MDSHQINIDQMVSCLALLFISLHTVRDPQHSVDMMSYIFKAISVLLNAPVDILTDMVQDKVHYGRNLKNYQRLKKRNDFWHLVPEQTQQSWIQNIAENSFMLTIDNKTLNESFLECNLSMTSSASSDRID